MSSNDLNTKELMVMRMLMNQQQSPQIQVSPVQDIGGGIAQGVGNIVNAILQKRFQTQQMSQVQKMLTDMQTEAAAAEQAKTERLYDSVLPIAQRLGMHPATVANMEASTVNELLKQDNERLNKEKNFQGLVAALKANNFSEEQATLAAAQVVGGAIPGGNLLTEDALKQRNFNTFSNSLQGGIGSADKGPFSPSSIMYGESLGLKPIDVADNTKRISEASTAATTAGYLPIEKKVGIEGQILQNQGQGITNQQEAIKLGRSASQMEAGTQLLGNEMPFPEYLQRIAALSNDPLAAFNTLSSNDVLYNKTNGKDPYFGYLSPDRFQQLQDMRNPASQKQPSSFVPMAPYEAGSSARQFVTERVGTMNPVNASLSGLGGPLGSLLYAGSTPQQRQSVQDAFGGLLNYAGQATSGFLGLPQQQNTGGSSRSF